MEQKAFTLLNRGMSRDTSISKVGESAAYENHNIRILARDNDTLLSVTNERGNREIVLGEDINIVGDLVGWNVLNNHIILFTHAEDNTDYIYRIDYDGDSFTMANGEPLYSNNLGFDLEHPIESVVYYETEDIQKIYWVDGKNVLRFMNFMADSVERTRWENDETYFDSNRRASFAVSVDITKDNSGNPRANGITQYLLTYYNKHGQETGYVWLSDIVYLSPTNRGGAADEFNNNKITLVFSNLDESFTNFRVYSIFRSSLNGTAVGYLVYDGEVKSGSVTVVDDASHLVSEDATRFFYLGSQAVRAGTLTHKDQTLFLGDLQSIGKESYSALTTAIESLYDHNTGMSNCISFRLSEPGDEVIGDIPYGEDTGTYNYQSQLTLTSSQILSFKGGEKYRFALTFRRQDGTTTEAFWIGDAENTLYPVITNGGEYIKRVVAQCNLPSSVVSAMDTCGFATAQLMIAEATYADRAVKAQGILNPTMFNVWDRYNDRLYGQSSWISRPRNSSFSWKHFDVVKKSTSSYGEIECNYWIEDNPTPFYQIEPTTGTIIDKLDGQDAPSRYIILYQISNDTSVGFTNGRFQVTAWVFEAKSGTASALENFDFPEMDYLMHRFEEESSGIIIDADSTYKTYITAKRNSAQDGHNWLVPTLKAQYTWLEEIIEYQTFKTWCDYVKDEGGKKDWWFIKGGSSFGYTKWYYAANARVLGRWESADSSVEIKGNDYSPAYCRKHLMFVDENLLTLNSPELSYEAVSFDNAENYKLRIVGIAKIANTYGDYVVNASPGKLPGENLIREKFAGKGDGLISWPLWKEYGLKKADEDDDAPIEPDVIYRTESYYAWDSDIVNYWLHMWNHPDKILGFTDPDGNDYSVLSTKTFANLRYSYDTVYTTTGVHSNTYELDSLRIFNYTSSQYVKINIGGTSYYYDANIDQSLIPPGTHKYPILYSNTYNDPNEGANSDTAFLYLNTPVPITYQSSPHAVLSLHTEDLIDTEGTYTQTILPYIIPDPDNNEEIWGSLPSNVVCPWWGKSNESYTNAVYSVNQTQFNFVTHPQASILTEQDKYLFVGEIYYDYTAEGATDTRYGDVANNHFVVAGPQYTLEQLRDNMSRDISIMYANRGDTYFQRWDCLKTYPAAATSATNGVTDITSVMLETHINIEGRTDNQKEVGYIASLDTEKFGSLNTVYSQQDNYFAQRDLDEDMDLDSYRSSITWTLPKQDSAEIDEWAHITLANSLKLDGDKGWCQALRRFQNGIIAFQDRGIAEVLFNSRTQLSTTDGVPVEIANSGKVDGKRYISNKYGCVNKWSITEGKSALYFVDNINKAFCAFNGDVEQVSSKHGFDVWFRRNNTLNPWTPGSFENIISFYDRIHSDVYLVKDSDGDESCLVYNEALGAFTSFYDYARVPMMTSVDDRFVSFRDSSLWLQNEGFYCNFFGEQYDYWAWYRVAPDMQGDKIWTNIDYRADVYGVLNDNYEMIPAEDELINADAYGDVEDTYKEDETFSSYRIWNEYQTTGDISLTRKDAFVDPVRKKFRIWRLTIPRALKEGTHRSGLDRIRNPWINLRFFKEVTDNKELMQLHDIVVKYFE